MLLSEKMAVLGQLVAGVAHEINSPLAAINASSENLLELISRVNYKLLEIGQSGISNAFFLLLNQLLEHLMMPKAVISGKEERVSRKKIQQGLENMAIDSQLAADFARQLVECGFRDDVNDYRELFLHPKAQEFIHLFYQIGQIRQLIENVRIAVNKTRKMVAALKNYSHSQETTEKQLIDLGEHLQTVLILYHSQMKYGIEVETDWPDNLPLVPALPDELSQVWTNIIQNAIQAMNGQGRLLIKITTDEQAVFVSITDNGPGIPPDKINKIFEPFFTTKPRGQGTGLGLDICRKIIDKHGGAISVQSRPGETTFTVRLPLATVYN
jgi:signal transduction histidine kinase